MAELNWTEVDGVPAVWVDAPGPLRAGLHFRAGVAYETPRSVGRLHLLEHLVVPPVEGAATHYAAAVGGVLTSFSVAGTPKEVVAFFRDVCSGLSHVADDALESEKLILSAEDASRAYSPIRTMLRIRYGARGYGLLGLAELGMKGATAEQLRLDAARFFVRGNCSMWFSGPIPSEMRLDLPAGSSQPLLDPQPQTRPMPAWYVDNAVGGVSVSSVVPRVPEATVFQVVAGRRMREVLREKFSVSYSPGLAYEPLSADSAHLVLHADSDPERRVDLVDAFGAMYAGLDAVTSDEIANAIDEYEQHTVGSMAPPPDVMAVGEANRAAVDWVFGRPFEGQAALRAGLRRATPESMAEFAASANETALFALRKGTPLRDWMGERANKSIHPTVSGRAVRAHDYPVRRDVLVSTDEGVSQIWADGTHHTVRYDDLAAALSYPDGALVLLGGDADSVGVEPTLWRRGPRALAGIRARVSSDAILEQDERDAARIPKPSASGLDRLKAALTSPDNSSLRRALAGGVMLVGGVIIATSMAQASGVISGELPLWIPGVVLAVLSVTMFLPQAPRSRPKRQARSNTNGAPESGQRGDTKPPTV